MGFLIEILISVLISVLAYAIQPKPKAPKPPATSDLEDPVAEQGKPIPVVFGTVTVKGMNILWWGEKKINIRTTKQSKK